MLCTRPRFPDTSDPPSPKNITTILQNGQDKVKNGTPSRTTGSYGLTRRATREKGGVQA